MKLNKQARQLQNAREEKRQWNHSVSINILHKIHWKELSDSKKKSNIEISKSDNNIADEEIKNILSAVKMKWSHAADAVKFSYQQESTLSECQQHHIHAAECELATAAKNHSQSLSHFFSLTSTTTSKKALILTDELQHQKQQEAIRDLERKLYFKKTVLNGQNLICHWAVLALLYMTQSHQNENHKELSYHVAQVFNKGLYFARKVVEWEGIWIQECNIPEGKWGCFAKTFSWFNDEDVQIVVHEWCAGAGDSKLF